MKKITKFLTLAVVMFAFAASTFGQVSATASTSATIISPLTINLATDLNFGTIISGAAGTVTIAPDGTRSTLGCTLYTADPGQAASFDVEGSPNLSYSIAITPASLTISNGTETMTVGSFASTPTVALGGNLDATGQQTILVGGTLTVNANQATGTYTNAADLTVTINYN